MTHSIVHSTDCRELGGFQQEVRHQAREMFKISLHWRCLLLDWLKGLHPCLRFRRADYGHADIRPANIVFDTLTRTLRLMHSGTHVGENGVSWPSAASPARPDSNYLLILS